MAIFLVNFLNMSQMASVVGGGPCGSLLAMYLKEQGFKVDVYEARTPAGMPASFGKIVSRRGRRGDSH